MKKSTLFILVISILFFTSCKEKEAKKINISDIKITGVVLNNGKLWQANIETTEGIKKMQQIVNSFSKENDVTKYKLFTAQLETEFSSVFAKCTMKGEAHNQLHNYLKPLIDIFDKLISDESKIRQKNYLVLNRHLAGYVNYFE